MRRTGGVMLFVPLLMLFKTSMNRPITSITFMLLHGPFFAAGVNDVELQCDPCIDRPTYHVQVIVHGTSDDAYWQGVRASSVQASKDMRVKLDFDLYEQFNPELMAADIIAATTGSSPPDALVVSIPSPVVESAVAEAAKLVPIFGMNSGYDVGERLGVLTYIAMDEYVAGVKAAEEFQKTKNVTRALFVNHEKGNAALEERFLGFNNTLQVHVDELVVDTTLPDNEINKNVQKALMGCPYDAILLAGGKTLESVISSIDTNDCSLSSSLGTFDTGHKEYAAIATGKLFFTISQQAHLQGTLSVVFAATYGTTGKRTSSSKDTIFGTYLSGPAIIRLQDLPSDTMQACEGDAFPVCPNTLAPDGITNSSCACLDRPKVKIGGVLHGVATDAFWDIVFVQARQAADDLGVELTLDRFEPQTDFQIVYNKMAQKMISLCHEGVDGLFISLASDLLIPAVKECQALNVPIMSVNSGAELAKELGLAHHISQLEYSGGYQAGIEIASQGITEAICLMHAEGNNALDSRCQGFEDGLKYISPDIKYLGAYSLPMDSDLLVIEGIKNTVNKEGDWDGLAMLLVSPTVLTGALEIKKSHPNFIMGVFDLNGEIYEALDSGTLLFGIDQNPFMQGYLPVWLLTTMVHSKQKLLNTYVETGPTFVYQAPTEALRVCTANNFKVCPRPVEYDYNQLTKVRPAGLAMAGISMFSSVAFSAWVRWNKDKKVVRKSQPLFMHMICLGTLLMASTIIPLSIDDSIASPETCTRACIATPWLLFIGFIATFSALFSKIYRIHKLFQSAKKFQRMKITVWDVMPLYIFILTLTIVFLLVWTIVDPQYWFRQPVFGSTDGLSTYGGCAIGNTSVSTAMLSCLIALAFICVILACIISWRARSLSVEYSESKYVGMVMMGMLQVLLLGIPIILLVNTNPPASYFVKTAIIFVLTMSILLLIFIPKVVFLRQENNANHENTPTRISGLPAKRSQPPHTSILTKDDDKTNIDGEITSRITNKSVEDLHNNLKNLGISMDLTELQSLLKTSGIEVLNN